MGVFSAGDLKYAGTLAEDALHARDDAILEVGPLRYAWPLSSCDLVAETPAEGYG